MCKSGPALLSYLYKLNTYARAHKKNKGKVSHHIFIVVWGGGDAFMGQAHNFRSKMKTSASLVGHTFPGVGCTGTHFNGLLAI